MSKQQKSIANIRSTLKKEIRFSILLKIYAFFNNTDNNTDTNITIYKIFKSFQCLLKY